MNKNKKYAVLSLSGGLDSSSVLACLSEVMKNDSAERSAKNWQKLHIDQNTILTKKTGNDASDNDTAK